MISRCLVMRISNGVVKAENKTILKENGGPLELIKDCARVLLKYVDWSKGKGMIGKVKFSKQFL